MAKRHGPRSHLTCSGTTGNGELSEKNFSCNKCLELTSNLFLVDEEKNDFIQENIDKFIDPVPGKAISKYVMVCYFGSKIVHGRTALSVRLYISASSFKVMLIVPSTDTRPHVIVCKIDISCLCFP